MLQNVDWLDLIHSTSDNNIGYNTLSAVLQQRYELSFPLTRQSRKACHYRKWMTLCLKKSCIKKDKLFKKWLLTRADCDKQKYLEYKKIFKIVSKKAQIVYYDE